jgi:hypothetical protein
MKRIFFLPFLLPTFLFLRNRYRFQYRMTMKFMGVQLRAMFPLTLISLESATKREKIARLHNIIIWGSASVCVAVLVRNVNTNIPAAEIRVAFGLMHAYVLRIGQLAHGLVHINSNPDWPLFTRHLLHGVYLLGSGATCFGVIFKFEHRSNRTFGDIPPFGRHLPQNNTQRILQHQLHTVTPFELLISQKITPSRQICL